METTGIINEYKVRLLAVPAGTKFTAVKREAGLTWDDDYTVIKFGDDVDDADDFRHVHPGAAKLLDDAGIDIGSLGAVIEVIL